MQDLEIRFESFIDKLRSAMNNRISAFERYMRNEFQKNPSKTIIKSKKQWMYEYKKWITENNTIEKEILKYLTESE